MCGRSWPALPASRVADTDLGDVVVLDVDATLVTSHSDKEQAAATFKGGFGYHPLAVWCGNTTEMLAVSLRAGNAGSNTATDHIDVLSAAIAQVPAAYRSRLLCQEASAELVQVWHQPVDDVRAGSTTTANTKTAWQQESPPLARGARTAAGRCHGPDGSSATTRG